MYCIRKDNTQSITRQGATEDYNHFKCSSQSSLFNSSPTQHRGRVPCLPNEVKLPHTYSSGKYIASTFNINNVIVLTLKLFPYILYLRWNRCVQSQNLVWKMVPQWTNQASNFNLFPFLPIVLNKTKKRSAGHLNFNFFCFFLSCLLVSYRVAVYTIHTIRLPHTKARRAFFKVKGGIPGEKLAGGDRSNSS